MGASIIEKDHKWRVNKRIDFRENLSEVVFRESRCICSMMNISQLRADCIAESQVAASLIAHDPHSPSSNCRSAFCSSGPGVESEFV